MSKFSDRPTCLQVGDILSDPEGQEGEIVKVGWKSYQLCVIKHNTREPGSTWLVYAHEFDDDGWTWRSGKSGDLCIEWEEDDE